MFILLKFLAYHMRSLDGNKGSGEDFIKKESRRGRNGGLMTES